MKRQKKARLVFPLSVLIEYHEDDNIAKAYRYDYVPLVFVVAACLWYLDYYSAEPLIAWALTIPSLFLQLRGYEPTEDGGWRRVSLGIGSPMSRVEIPLQPRGVKPGPPETWRHHRRHQTQKRRL
jgi:hypothetical protein